MRNITKKMMISILTTVIILITMVATTYAWVGIFTYSSTGDFNLNLKVEDLDQDYFLTISNTGEINTFSDSTSDIEIKRQILMNRQIKSDYIDLETADEETIEYLFEHNNVLEPVTTNIINNSLDSFKTVNISNTWKFEMIESNAYYKMDVYLSVDTKEGIQETTEVNSDVYISDIESTLSGLIGNFKFFNGNPFYELPSNSMSDVLISIPKYDYFNVNSANATRFALSIYNPIPIENSYNNSDLPVKTIIYQGGKQTPSYDSETDTFDLGGNLPEDYNSALQEILDIRINYNKHPNPKFNEYYRDCLNIAVERGRNDLELCKENSLVWDSPDSIENESYLGIYKGIQTKMKITIYFWFEGWDADCLEGITQLPVNFDLKFTAFKEDE